MPKNVIVEDIKPKNVIERNEGSFQSNSTDWSSSTATWSSASVTWGGFHGISDIGPRNVRVNNEVSNNERVTEEKSRNAFVRDIKPTMMEVIDE